MTEILVGVLLFTAIVMVLVTAITAARAVLLPRGRVTIRVNDRHEFVVSPGGKLLTALAAHDVYLPSACAGAGTCGGCRLRVLDGGGAILPTERVHIPRQAVLRGERLACQVPVKGDMVVEVPPGVLAAHKYTCRVRSNLNVATYIKETVLELPDSADFDFRAGDYIQIHVPPYNVAFRELDIDARYREDWERYDFFDLVSSVPEAFTRAYSMASHPGEHGIIRLNVRIATPPPGAPSDVPPGRASSYVFGLRPGDEVVVSGPFGDFGVREGDSEMVYIGGGAGMAPLRSQLLDLLEGGTRRRISYWYGARSRREIFYQDEFERLAREHQNFEFHVGLSEPLPEDEWAGSTGFIHQVVFDEYLRDHVAPEDIDYYLCGPPPMVSAVMAMLDDMGVEPENISYDDFET